MSSEPGSNQYLTFTLDEHTFGLDILRVQELKGHSTITALPNTPPHVRGVINLRGTIIPVIDLRTRFGMTAREFHKYTVIIVVTVGSKVMGLAVDGVADVLAVPTASVQPAPAISPGSEAQLIAGLAHSLDGVIVLLDIDRLLDADELAQLPVS